MGNIRGPATQRKVIALKNGRGVILISVLIILSFLSILGLSLIAFVFSRVIKAEMEVERLKAFYFAEAGIAISLSELKRNMDFNENGIGNVPATPFKDGMYEAVANQETGIITGIGECEGIRREIEIKYKAF